MKLLFSLLVILTLVLSSEHSQAEHRAILVLYDQKWLKAQEVKRHLTEHYQIAENLVQLEWSSNPLQKSKKAYLEIGVDNTENIKILAADVPWIEQTLKVFYSKGERQ